MRTPPMQGGQEGHEGRDGWARDGTENNGEADVKNQFVLSLKQQPVLPIILPLSYSLFFSLSQCKATEGGNQRKKGRVCKGREDVEEVQPSSLLVPPFRDAGWVVFKMAS